MHSTDVKRYYVIRSDNFNVLFIKRFVPVGSFLAVQLEFIIVYFVGMAVELELEFQTPAPDI